VFFGFIVLLKAAGIEPSTPFRFINPMNSRNTTNSMNPFITLKSFTVRWDARMLGGWDAVVR
jgi:hypothetical protein